MSTSIVTLHYSCGVNNDDPASNPISYIVVYPDDAPALMFDTWVDGEAAALESFNACLDRLREKTWLAWRCLKREYGFPHLAARYKALTGGTMTQPSQIIDLKEVLKDSYGTESAPHPRLESAARNNNITMLDLLTAEEAATAFREQNYNALRANAARRCAIIRDLYRVHQHGRFRAANVESNLLALLKLLTNGIVDDRVTRASGLLADDTLTVNEKLAKIDALIPILPTVSAEQLGEMLGVSKQAVLKTDWWIQNRKGEKDSEVGRRLEGHRRRARSYESPSQDDE